MDIERLNLWKELLTSKEQDRFLAGVKLFLDKHGMFPGFRKEALWLNRNAKEALARLLTENWKMLGVLAGKAVGVKQFNAMKAETVKKAEGLAQLVLKYSPSAFDDLADRLKVDYTGENTAPLLVEKETGQETSLSRNGSLAASCFLGDSFPENLHELSCYLQDKKVPQEEFVQELKKSFDQTPLGGLQELLTLRRPVQELFALLSRSDDFENEMMFSLVPVLERLNGRARVARERLFVLGQDEAQKLLAADDALLHRVADVLLEELLATDKTEPSPLDIPLLLQSAGATRFLSAVQSPDCRPGAEQAAVLHRVFGESFVAKIFEERFPFEFIRPLQIFLDWARSGTLPRKKADLSLLKDAAADLQKTAPLFTREVLSGMLARQEHPQSTALGYFSPDLVLDVLRQMDPVRVAGLLVADDFPAHILASPQVKAFAESVLKELPAADAGETEAVSEAADPAQESGESTEPSYRGTDGEQENDPEQEQTQAFLAEIDRLVRNNCVDSALQKVSAAFRSQPENAELCRAAARLFTRQKMYLAATEYFLENTLLVPEEKLFEASREFVLSRIRSEGWAAAQEEVKAFREDFGDLVPEAFSDEVKAAIGEHKNYPQLRRFFRDAGDFFWKSGPEYQEKQLVALANQWMGSNKAMALELLCCAVQQVPESAMLFRQLAQTENGLALYRGSADNWLACVQRDPRAKSAVDAEQSAVRCFIKRGLKAEAEDVLASLRKRAVAPSVIDALQSLVAGETPSLAKAKEKSAALRETGQPVPSLLQRQGLDPEEHEKFFCRTLPIPPQFLSYPQDIVGCIFSRNGHVNLFPIFIRYQDQWHHLTLEQVRTLCPQFGAYGFQNLSPKDKARLKDGMVVYAHLEQTDVVGTGDPSYVFGIEAHVGREVDGVSKVGALIVHENEPADFTGDVFVSPVFSGTPSVSASIFSGERVLLLREGKLFGPFRVLSDASGRLYIPRLAPEDLRSVTQWTPAGAGALSFFSLRSGGDLPETYCLAFTGEPDAFQKEQVNLLTDALLLKFLVRKTANAALPEDVETVIRTSECVGDEQTRQRLLQCVRSINDASQLKGELQSLLTEQAVAVLTAELKAQDRPLTRLLTAAVARESNLDSLARELVGAEEQMKADFARRRAELEAEQQAALDAVAQNVEKKKQEKEQELAGLDGKIREKIAFWEETLRAMVAKHRMELAEAAIEPLMKSESIEKEEEEAVAAVSPFAGTPLRGSALREELISRVQRRRAFSRDEVIDLYLSVALNFLTIFSGDPGSGKTSTCAILADAMGLRRPQERYLSVSVERGWTNKRDFLGYYNPLTQSYEAADKRRSNAFRALSREAQENFAGAPYVMLLDEANLSPMEYYWADFMNVCDEDSVHREIVLGDSTVVKIPRHLRFLATINIDETTENLSPRLIDRSWIVRLNDAKTLPVPEDKDDSFVVFWKDFHDAFAADLLQEIALAPEILSLCDHFARVNVTVSKRSRNAIARFCSAGRLLFSDGDRTACDFAVAQKLLPLVRGNGPEFRGWLAKLRELTDKMPVSARIVEQILARGARDLDYYRYF